MTEEGWRRAERELEEAAPALSVRELANAVWGLALAERLGDRVEQAVVGFLKIAMIDPDMMGPCGDAGTGKLAQDRDIVPVVAVVLT